MVALAKRVVAEVVEAKEPEVLIHLRFHPNAEIASIDRKPANLSAQEWYTRLCEGAYDHYRAFAGGRGFFRLPQSVYDGIVAKA